MDRNSQLTLTEIGALWRSASRTGSVVAAAGDDTPHIPHGHPRGAGGWPHSPSWNCVGPTNRTTPTDSVSFPARAFLEKTVPFLPTIDRDAFSPRL